MASAGGNGDDMTATARQGQQPAADGAARVVVVGAGFGGLAAVRKLARSGARVTLVDRNIYSTFQPLLYEVASAGLSGSDVAYPVRAVSHRLGAVSGTENLPLSSPRPGRSCWPMGRGSAMTISSWPLA